MSIARRKATVARVQLRALPKSTIPERPPTAYILFAQDARNRVIDELGGVDSKPSFTQIANAMGKKWKELGDGEREVDALFSVVCFARGSGLGGVWTLSNNARPS